MHTSVALNRNILQNPGTPPNLRQLRLLTNMRQPGVGASYWTDAYLAAFAKQHDYAFATFDRGFTRWRQREVFLLSE